MALGAKRFALQDFYKRPLRITLPEFGIVASVVIIVALVVTVLIGPSAAQAHAAQGYHQFLNGSIVQAGTNTYTCTRDGPCNHTYDCDPYPVTIHHAAVTDSKGNVVSPAYDTTEIHYHDCPYATEEFTYYLVDSLSRNLPIASHIFSAEPQEFRGGNGIPGDVQRGVPPRWLQSKQRLDAGDAEGVTETGDYTNYILPSDDQTFRQYSTSVDKYRKANLLPEHTQNLNGSVLFDFDMQAAKVQFVGVTSSDQALWQERLMSFNASLGSERRGDLHIVVVPADQVPDPDDYINALTAFWQSSLGKWGFPKNGISLAIGVDNNAQTIKWSRAKTGMPIGNGEMLAALSFNLQGQAFNADNVLGQIKAQPVVGDDGKPAVKYQHGNGLVDKIMFTDYPFRRACMRCEDKDDDGTSYVYLKDSIPVSTGAKLMMFAIVALIALVLSGVALYFDPIGALRGTSSREISEILNPRAKYRRY